MNSKWLGISKTCEDGIKKRLSRHTILFRLVAGSSGWWWVRVGCQNSSVDVDVVVFLVLAGQLYTGIYLTKGTAPKCLGCISKYSMPSLTKKYLWMRQTLIMGVRGKSFFSLICKAWTLENKLWTVGNAIQMTIKLNLPRASLHLFHYKYETSACRRERESVTTPSFKNADPPFGRCS